MVRVRLDPGERPQVQVDGVVITGRHWSDCDIQGVEKSIESFLAGRTLTLSWP